MTILTHAQLQDLATLVNQANAHPSNAAMREAYYQQLADDGENYGALAKGVVQGTTLAGYVADQFLKDQAQSIYGKTLSATDIQNISLCLMDADLSARQHSDNVLARPPICRIDAIWHITTRFRVSAPRSPLLALKVARTALLHLRRAPVADRRAFYSLVLFPPRR